ncbi:hypothetical protein CWATWH0402_1977 [Crocosphaera watsonii WH 0402]|uniref:Uncharacterized protein n=1 Tax=Crocosphaera watsonii WH 0402 TaxID=1284629 RepID=T2JSI0_CROWT|nr:hypothetical protein [Crocosphaera watsonii]CCQ68001.1 hypothetical protein CWATWH0402_1977 [Crocosphaera watsonii WH 0402]
MSLSDNTALIGGFGDDDQGLNSGSAYLLMSPQVISYKS